MTERFQLAANVLLSRRLKNLVRIDENVEIDLNYITCAEYQLFIDEMRQAGKNRQPDHWIDYRFSPGDAQKPISGVRASDAEEFCEWLTQQHSALGFRYRLPTLVEAEENPATEQQIGCWCNDRGEQVIAGIKATQLQDWYSNLAEIVILNHHLYGKLNRFLNLNLNQDLYSNLYGKLNRFLYLYSDLYGKLNRFLNRNRDLNHVLYLNLNGFLNHVLNRNLNRDLNRFAYGDLNRDLNHFLNRDLNQDLYNRIEVDKASDFLILYFPLLFFIVIYQVLFVTYKTVSQNREVLKEIHLSSQKSEAISREYQARIDEIYPLYVYLVLLDERQAGRIPAWEGIRLVREKIDLNL
ncbi:MAG: SUMF1/EgtB/PvdO family nonheme iron enzyme [Symploca sp. SIO2C1]|nr:SUMF1/EgtB/PvdO family nonheme iron enzyme [Symploca sp. SIO2C1]